MIAVALLLGTQSGLALTFPTGGEMVYQESWRVEETSRGATLSASAERTVRFRVKETSKGRTRFETAFDSVSVRGDNKGLIDDLRGWIQEENRDQWVTDRGYVERRNPSIRGPRPFFGIVLPSTDRSLPDKWTAKLLLPIGGDRQATFSYHVGSTTGNTIGVRVESASKADGVEIKVGGHVDVMADGSIVGGDLTTRIEDESDKTSTVVEYRFQKR